MPDGTAGRAIAVIPARGGSKRIPRKNIKSFHGVPLLVRTIGILQNAAVFDRIIVSTDDDEIAEIAVSAGADVPFRRPAELADDFAATVPVIAHATVEMVRLGAEFDWVCCVYPAAVFSTPLDYQESGRVLRESAVDYVFTATSFPYPIQRALRLTEDGGCDLFWAENREKRSQDLEPAFHDAGQFYFGRRLAWIEQRPLFSARSRMHMLPRHRVQDIDTPEDWARAEMLFALLSGDNGHS